MNASVRSMIENKRLNFSVDKCLQMHIGGSELTCPKLKVHESKMKKAEKQKYLGDILTNDFKVKENIKARNIKGISIVNTITSLLKEISFGKYHFEMGLVLRNSFLINGIMFKLEALNNLKKKHLESIEECDKSFCKISSIVLVLYQLKHIILKLQPSL